MNQKHIFNISRNECAIYMESPGPNYVDTTRFVITIVLSLFSVLTIVGNIFVIYIVIKRIRPHSNPHIFVVSLAIADVFVAVLVMPFSIYQEYMNGVWKLGQTVCLVTVSFDVMFTTTSILHLMCMTVDRYVAICHPFRYHDRITKRTVTILLICCWVIPAVMSFGLIFSKIHIIGIEEFYDCIVAQGESCLFRVNAFYAIVCSCIAFYLPSFCMLLWNTQIFLRVREQGKEMRDLTLSTSDTAHKHNLFHREAKVARTIAMMLGCFFVCWLPYFVINIVDPLIGYNIEYLPWKITLWLGYINSTINPYLFYFLNRPSRNTNKRLGNSWKHLVAKDAHSQNGILKSLPASVHYPRASDKYIEERFGIKKGLRRKDSARRMACIEV